MKNVKELISFHEGRVSHAYRDSLGYLTIGVGHLIDKSKGGSLPPHIIDALLDYDIQEHSAELFKELPWVATLDSVRQAALIDMYFNMRRGMLQFVKTLGYLESGRWDDAADEMGRSKWAAQVGARATRLAQMIRTGQWPKEA
jgi:lysozyme